MAYLPPLPTKNADGTDAQMTQVPGVAKYTNTPLSANGSWTTGWIPYGQYGGGSIFLKTDVPSATNGYVFEFSGDGGATVLDAIQSTYGATDLRGSIFPVGKGTHCRVTYTNGASPQTFLFLAFTLHNQITPSINSTMTPVNASMVAEVTKAFLQLPDGSNIFDFIQRTANSLNVNVTNQVSTQTISGSVEVSNDSGSPLPVSGTVNIGNLPTTQPISGTVSIGNLPSTQPVSGTVTANVTFPSTQAVSGTVAVSNFPSTVEISNDSGNAIPVSGTVSISNLPATQPVSGTVSVSNFPATQPVSGTVTANVTFPTTQAVSGSVSVSNLPSTQPVSAVSLPLPSGAATSAKQDTGNTSLASIDTKLTSPLTVSVNNFPASVEISNDSGSAIPVSNASLPLPTGAATSSNQSTEITALQAIQAAIGAISDSQATNGTSSWSVDALLKGVYTQLSGINTDQGTISDTAATDSTSSWGEIALLKGLMAQLIGINTDQGTISDAQATNSTSSWGEIALLKGIMQRPATGTSTTVTIGATVTTLLAANANRKGATIFSSNGTALILLGSGASASVYSTRIITNGYYEVPFGYTGIITAFTNATVVNITELT